jgi:hypothetical protein
MPIPSRIRSLRFWSAVATGVLLAACSSSVIVESKFPSPLVEALPVKMGILIPEELYNYIYTEEIRDESLWTIALGDANVAMFTPLFAKMFQETHNVDAVPLASNGDSLDGVLKPTIEKFEFDIPTNEKNKFVEVWIQYQLTLFEPNGNTIVAWPVSGYGKHELGHSKEDAVQRAAITAMREVGAAIATKFAQQPQIKSWLAEKQHGPTADVGVATAQSEVVH